MGIFLRKRVMVWQSLPVGKQGFTLIELLIVIGIIGVLAAVVLVGIDPVDKIAAANDTKVQRDVQALATAMESYAVTHDGLYPTGADNAIQNILIASGDLKAIICPPSGYNTFWSGGSAPCNGNLYAMAGSSYPTVRIASQLKSKKYTSNPWWVWCADSGKAAALTSAGTCP